MKLLYSLCHLGLFLSSAVLASEILHAGEQLNENNFDSLTKEGLCPFCAACKRFAPSWIELVEKMKPNEVQGLKMGQVDCIAQGDLCARLDVHSYPTMQLFYNGKAEESYSGEKSVEAIQKYLEDKVEAYRSLSEPAKQHVPFGHHSGSMPSPDTYAFDYPVPQASPPPESEDPILQPIPATPDDTPIDLPNPLGYVIRLHGDNFDSYTDPAQNPFPIFVHFHAAWCKECRTLAPVWEKTANLLKNQVNVGEIDCDVKWNKKICKREHIVEFPTFIIYHEGTKLAYSGPKVPSSMADFILHTVATPGTHEITMAEFDEAIKKKDIFFLFLHSSRTPISIVQDKRANGALKCVQNSVQTVGKGLLGSAVIHKSDHQDIYSRLGLSHYYAYLLVFKEHDANPWASVKLEEESPKVEANPTLRHRRMTLFIRHWIAVHSIPVFDELDQLNYHRVFNSGVKKLVVLACLSGIVPSPDGIDLVRSNPRSVQLKNEMKSWALQWLKSQQARAADDIIVDWVWVNSEVWSEWLYVRPFSYPSPIMLLFSDERHFGACQNAYGVNLPRPTEDPRESSMILIIDAQHHRYYDTQPDGHDIEFSAPSVFQTLLAVEMRKISGKMTGTLWSRMSWPIFRPQWLLLWVVILGMVGYALKSSRRGNGAVGLYSPMISPQMAKSFQRGLSSPDSFNPKSSPTIGSVFGLASNVPCKAD
ncbi:hypothetical protein VP01_458g3 [Puccinia sorghi]|uniref:Thioredoxin domain-containing protein n=1 Tax=Puccinia sorghi TaxID=27349 RepID=A0A0L6UPD3_9BASI|nr:hypothetical protein VP01_458g3 [Puccinia sorghi]